MPGDSAGGNLTLATALRTRKNPRLFGCLMIYATILHSNSGMRAYTGHACTGTITTLTLRCFFDTYLNDLALAGPQTEVMFMGNRTSLSGWQVLC